MYMSLTLGGILVTVVGTFLVNTVGITDTCSNELTAKAIEFAPLVIGSLTAWIGRVRLGDVRWYGVRK